MLNCRWLSASFALSLVIPLAPTVCTVAQAVPAAPGTSYALTPPAERKPVPDFALTGVNGRRITLAHDRGQVVLLDFWAVDCGGCRIEIPWYVDFDQKYGSQGLALIGLDMYGESPAKIRPFMVRSHMDYPVAVGTDALGARFHVTEMPLTLLIDRKGRVAIAHAGIVDRARFESDIRTLLAEK
ncbi:MAG TPA: TlpA disulfide reductase family protein [Acidobacteriaceae bacterium]|jgi:cytochrome c biogenesis protein CcmG/thiol:disulfide interchange protein DsbE|nr:TlpA disulfide reductase family protein [Acidobacteriaceae bacterium]